MKKLLCLLVFFFVAVSVLGCSSTYTIRTKDGREYISDGEPDITGDQFVKFETKAGRKVILKQDEVSSIEED